MSVLTPLLWILSLALTACLPLEAVADYRHAFELGLGNQIPTQQRIRDGFDTDLHLVAGYSSVFDSAVTARLQVEMSWTRSSGHFFNVDPTFEVDETELDVLGAAVGATRFFRTYADSPFELHLGIGLAAQRLVWNAPGPGEDTAFNYGIYADLRPELRILPGWHLWVRQRLMGTSEVQFDNSDVTDSGVLFSAGIRYGFGEINR